MTAVSRGRSRQIQVDTIGFLANNLRGYEPTSILREQLQNADDASSVQGRSGELTLRFLGDRLEVTNPSVFSDDDWDRLTKPNSRGKIADANQTGEFGVGFWGSLHLTDAPIVTSGQLRMTLDPRDTFEEEEVPYFDGTRVEFVYRRTPTELGAKLDAGVITQATETAMAATFLDQMAELLLFTRAIDAIRIQLPDGSERLARRRVEPVAEGVDRTIVSVEGAPDATCDYLLVRSIVESPPAGRHNRVTVALPISERHRGPGRAFFMFPTETDSGMCLSIDAHFRATDDRRSLENSGEHGNWNDRIFEAAGDALGRALETVLSVDVHGLALEDAYGWFLSSGAHQAEIARRAAIFTSRLDNHARLRRVIPDRKGALHRGSGLVDLPVELESLLGDVVGESALKVHRTEIRALFRRWGLVRWGPPEVARWLSGRLPRIPTKQVESEKFVQRSEDALALLDYCKSQEGLLKGSALLLATDGQYHPIGGQTVHRATLELARLATGLGQPLVSDSFMRSWPALLAPQVTPQWLRSALLGAKDKLVGKRVGGARGLGVAERQQHVLDAIEIVKRAAGGLAGVPLALDEDNTLREFDDHILTGLPDSGRKNAELLARRLGFTPLHRALDEAGLEDVGVKLSISLINEVIPTVKDWDPVDDSRLLVEVLGTLSAGRVVSTALIDQLRNQRIWAASDGAVRTLAELRLPARDRIPRASLPLVADRLLGEVSAVAPVYSTLKGLLRVDILDSTEETVMACENPPSTIEELRGLLFELADCGSLSKAQAERLMVSAFVLCRDGQRRRPSDVVMALDDLPLHLGDSCIDSEVGPDRKVRECLERLGARQLPDAADIVGVAAAIAATPLEADLSRDPGRALWDFLERAHEMIPPATLGQLGDICWLAAEPGPKRYRPRHCYDPSLSYAKFEFPVPLGVRSPHQQLRKALGIRESIDIEDCRKLAYKASELGHSLPSAYFRELNRRCASGPDDSRKIATLRSLALVPLSTGLVAPDSLVSRARSEIWGHLRAVVPTEFVDQYPALLSAWGIVVDGEPGWKEHLDVLGELAAEPELSRKAHALALERLRSIAELPLDEHQLQTVFAHGYLLTSLGLQPCAETFRRDMVPTVVDRVDRTLPIAEESADLIALLDSLRVRSLRESIDLDAVVEGAVLDERWPKVFQLHSANVVRFLKLSSTRLDEELLAAWPPTIKSVTSLTIRASMGGSPLNEWSAGAHLYRDRGEPILYVTADSLDARAVVDAIAYAFGVDRNKSALLGVLTSASAHEGSELLDWEQIPPLTERETSLLGEHEEVEVVIEDEPAPGIDPQPVVTAFSPVGRGAARVEPAADESLFSLPAPPIVPTAVGESESFSKEAQPGDKPFQDWPPNTVLDDVRSPRGVTDISELEDAGIEVVRDSEPAPAEASYEPQAADATDTPGNNEVRVVLSFLDVSLGLVPVPPGSVAWLASGVALREVEIFGQTLSAEVTGQRHIRIAEGAELYHSRQVVPGTVFRLFASVPGRIEIVVRPDIHHLDGVWMLELDDNGKLNRLELHNVELQWETDDAFYRAERRKEDIEALMADTGKSAVNLIIDVFRSRPGAGLTVDQIWGLVAINRLFAKGTISQTLSYQSLLFSNLGGMWFMTGNQLKMPRSSGSGRKAPDRSPAKSGALSQPTPGSEAMKLAGKLALLLPELGEEMLATIVQRLGIRNLLADSNFSRACDSYLTNGDPRVLEALESDIRRDPGLSSIAVERLGALDTKALATRVDLLEIVRREGTANAVKRALDMLSRLESLTGAADAADPIDAAAHHARAFAEGGDVGVEMWEAIVRMWQQRRWGDPQLAPSDWLGALAAMEAIDRQASKLAEPPELAVRARNEALGWLLAQLPAASFDAPDTQRLRVVLDLLRGADTTDVLDGLHQLGLLAEKTPGREADSQLLYGLVGVYGARVNKNTTRVVVFSRRKARERCTGSTSEATERFVELWLALTRTARSELDREIARR